LVKGIRRIGRLLLGCLALSFLSYATGCEYFPESSFQLANESRLPKWFNLPLGLTRADVSVTMNYYSTPGIGVATFILQDKKNRTLGKIYATQKRGGPFDSNGFPVSPADYYPCFEVITANGITEIVEHKKMEPIFYITDDPAVWKALMGAQPPAGSQAITPKNPAIPTPPHQ
jgi:hypothetical protein